jgi:hypothetical protein
LLPSPRTIKSTDTLTPAAFRSRLPPNFIFEFRDGPFSASPAPATDIIFESHHLAWWLLPTTISGIRDAHKALDAYLDEHGPFDILLGFSQGCSLIGSYLLYHAREKPTNTPPRFKAAVFICGGLPLAALEDLGVDVPERAKSIDAATGKLLRKRTENLARLAEDPSQVTRGMDNWSEVADLLHHPERAPEQSDVFGLDFTAMPEDLRIRIPTVHVLGAKDPRWPAAYQLAQFCDRKRVYDHGGGHEIPRSSVVSDKIAELVEEVAREMQGEGV